MLNRELRRQQGRLYARAADRLVLVARVEEHGDRTGVARGHHVRLAVPVQVADHDRVRLASGWVVELCSEGAVASVQEDGRDARLVKLPFCGRQVGLAIAV